MVQAHRVTVVAAVPPLARALARHPLVDRYDLSSLRLVLIGAAPCPTEIERECRARLGCAVGQSFGMTELAPIALPEEDWRPRVARAPGAGDRGGRRRSRQRRAAGRGGAGRAVAARAGAHGAATWATRPRPRRRSTPRAGCTPATSALFDEDGHLFVVDRLKELIKCPRLSGGARAARGRTRAAPGRRRRRGRRAARRGGRRAAGGLRRAARRGSAPGILEWLAGRVAPYKRPVEVVVVDEVPRNPTGKLLRRVLVERERATAAGRSPASGRAPERLLLTPR